MSRRLPIVSAGLVALAIPATAGPLAPATAGVAAALRADAPCYIAGQQMAISGSGWTPSSSWTVRGPGILEEGTADETGRFVARADAPAPRSSSSTRPEKFTLSGDRDGTEVARTTVRTVNFHVQPKSVNGKPTGKTTWGFSGFLPGKKIYVHVKRGRKVWTQKAGKGARPCGTLRKRMRRLPAVPKRKISYGRYKVFVDNRKGFRVGGLQYRATITIFRTFK